MATPSITSSASLYSEDLGRQSETREWLSCSDWLASIEAALACAMICSQNTQNKVSLLINKRASRVKDEAAIQASNLPDKTPFEKHPGRPEHSCQSWPLILICGLKALIKANMNIA